MLEMPFVRDDVAQERIERPIVVDQAPIEDPGIPVVQDPADIEDDRRRRDGSLDIGWSQAQVA